MLICGDTGWIRLALGVSFRFTAGYPYTSQKAGPYRQRDSGGNWLRRMQQVRIGADLFCWLGTSPCPKGPILLPRCGSNTACLGLATFPV